MEKVGRVKFKSGQVDSAETTNEGPLHGSKSLAPPAFQLKASPIQLQKGEAEFPYDGIVKGAWSVALRSTPSKDQNNPHKNTIADIPKGAPVVVKSRSGGWLQVAWNGKVGFVSQELIAKKTVKPSDFLGPVAPGSVSDKSSKAPALTVDVKDILAGAIHNTQTPPPIPATKVIETTNEATSHYYNGGGASVDIGPNSIQALLDSDGFKARHKRITGGLTSSLTGNFSVDMTWIVFHIGRTNVEYNVICNGDQCTVTYKLFVNDGFWDPNFVGENTLGALGFDSYQPDGMGPNLEESDGHPYHYNTAIRSFTFKNPGY